MPSATPVLDSTQFRARALAEAGRVSASPALVVADRQTAGRGRGNNRWWTGEGSLAFSLLVDPQQFGFPPRVVPRLSLAAGVAVIDAIAPRLSGQSLGLHWPNDVYVGRGKLAGILVEVLPDGRHIIGIGLNSNNTAADAPPEIRESIATLADLTGRAHDHTDLLVALLENLEATLVQLGEPVGTARRAIRSAVPAARRSADGASRRAKNHRPLRRHRPRWGTAAGNAGRASSRFSAARLKPQGSPDG